MNKIKKYNLILLPLLIIIILILSIYFYNLKGEKKNIIGYTNFLTMVEQNKIDTVFLSDSEFIKVVTKDNIIYYTENPRSQNFKEMLLLKNVHVKEDSSNVANTIGGILFFVIVTVFIITLLSKKIASSSKSMSSIEYDTKSATKVTFNNIAGNEEAKESILELVDFIKNPEKYAKFGARPPRGIILYGPPGTGKTLLAKALANEADVPFFAVNGSDFVQIYVGVGAARIRDLFKKAREKGKAVIFIDEIDAIGKKRTSRADGGSDERDQTLNALLSEMSGFKDSQGIVVIAATNRLDVLDDALLRPGRFDRHIEVNLPDIKARYEILKLYTKNRPISEDVDLFKLAEMTPYFSGAKLENLVNEAAILAAKESAEFITNYHFDKAFNIIIAGFEKKDRSYISDMDKKITAYHEAGHALISKLVAPEISVKKVTIIPSTKGAGGYTLNVPPDKMFKTKSDLLKQVKIALGGRAAEEIIFGKENITTGAYSDLQHVTNILLNMAQEYGMLEETGLINYGLIEGLNLNENVETIKKKVNEIYSEVVNLLSLNKDKLDILAEYLIKNETIFENEIISLLSLK
ncbi:ATP-dependent metallopeptidase FtsH/Yme1/Tma family protein [Caloramator sp. CAR-1]|uniref:ATP-dependent metallopeptidase FtsH/Yme1/Tma family protein n=1 Tax=Caloramator sp. CAR-1 TaxID=3062777 RepID=UPI0026E47528|nr:ATP-dependent metallopeptidase FtsH/Yme1/Tma family protein [Caloramator sp. CAR-1]MDO6354229.1 ATP-dependent metallopeptidase FtsH/Yme1/Tma family protein [Caloramator sp. CAR-1]